MNKEKTYFTLHPQVGWLIFSLLICFTNCKRELISPPENNSFQEKIENWLDKQKNTPEKNSKISNTGNKDANIDLLKENLDYNGLTSTALDSKSSILVVPVGETVKTEKNLYRNSTLILYLFVDKLGKIRDGGVIYYIPEDEIQHGKFTASDITNLITKTNRVKENGIYRFLSVRGQWFSQIVIRNGKQYSVGNVQPKNKVVKSKTLTNSGCTDWYLVTTYFYSDGTTSEDWQYIGTTCDGCNDGTYQSLCPDGSGGGSGGSEQPVEQTLEVNIEGGSYTENIPSELTGGGPNDWGVETTTWWYPCGITYSEVFGFKWIVNIKQHDPQPHPKQKTGGDQTHGYYDVTFSAGPFSPGTQQRITSSSYRCSWSFVEYRVFTKPGFWRQLSFDRLEFRIVSV